MKNYHLKLKMVVKCYLIKFELFIEIYKLHSDKNKYKNAIRSKSFNLKDPKNTLSMRVKNGEITPIVLAKMTSEVY